jgi:hypothetical protein
MATDAEIYLAVISAHWKVGDAIKIKPLDGMPGRVVRI